MQPAHLVQHRVAGLIASLRGLDPRAVLRWVLVFCQGLLIANAWDAFGPHPGVPHVPIVDLASGFHWGWPLLVTLLIVLVRPRLGLPLHAAVLTASILTDQLRIQSHWISLAVLLIATGPWAWARLLGWAHLASLWLWAGIMKAVSTGFGDGTAAIVAGNLGMPWLRPIAAVGIPVWEIGLGVLAARAATREHAIVPAVALHLGAIFVLRMGLDWEILWWNLGIAAAAPVLLRVRGGRRIGERGGLRAGLTSMLVMGLFVYPAGVFTDTVDPYLGHVLYSGAVPHHAVCEPDGSCSSWPIDVSATGLGGVVIPPAKRIYRGWFVRWCAPGQTLHVSGMGLRWPLSELPAGQPMSMRCPV